MSKTPPNLERAYTRYERHLRLEKLSVPDNVGTLAILYSTHQRQERQTEIFQSEAHEIYAQTEAGGHKATVIECDGDDPVYDVVRSPEYSSLITIGNGSFSEFWVPRVMSKRPKKINWYQVSRNTNHLKDGSFIHRCCGHFTMQLSLPFGTFLMRSPQNILGSVGRGIPDRNPSEKALNRPIFKREFTLEELSDLATKRFHYAHKGRLH